MENLVKKLLMNIGENPNREGLKSTPKRVSNTYKYLTSGYNIDIKDVINKAIYHENIDDMIVIKDIEFYSLCEHHIIPFFGKVHIGYIPNGKIIGLSKLPRIVEVYSKRLQLQERLSNNIATAINDILTPKGVGVIIEAKHLCMMMRGIEKQNSVTISSSMLGLFKEDPKTRNEFLSLVR